MVGRLRHKNAMLRIGRTSSPFKNHLTLRRRRRRPAESKVRRTSSRPRTQVLILARSSLLTPFKLPEISAEVTEGGRRGPKFGERAGEGGISEEGADPMLRDNEENEGGGGGEYAASNVIGGGGGDEADAEDES